jgi:hypothetical protein
VIPLTTGEIDTMEDAVFDKTATLSREAAPASDGMGGSIETPDTVTLSLPISIVPWDSQGLQETAGDGRVTRQLFRIKFPVATTVLAGDRITESGTTYRVQMVRPPISQRAFGQAQAVVES